MLRLIIVSCALLLVTAAATNVRECTEGRPFPLSVVVDGCDELPCELVKGNTVLMDVHFVSTKDDVRNLTAKVRATTFGVTVNYVLPTDVADVCSNLMYGAFCPIYATEDVVYQFKFYLEAWIPEVSVQVEVSLVDEESTTMACFIVDAKVKKGAANPV